MLAKLEFFGGQQQLLASLVFMIREALAAFAGKIIKTCFLRRLIVLLYVYNIHI
jgi:hypothetical protein